MPHLYSRLFGILVAITPICIYGAPTPAPIVEVRETPDPYLVIENFGPVATGIYRGAKLDTRGLEALAGLGVKTVLNLQGGDLETRRWEGLLQATIPYYEPGETKQARDAERFWAVGKYGIRFYINIPLDSLDPMTRQEDAAVEKILAILHDPTYYPIYIHCEHGKDRTGLLVALYRLKFEGASMREVKAEMAMMGHDGYLDSYFTGSMDTYLEQKAIELHRWP